MRGLEGMGHVWVPGAQQCWHMWSHICAAAAAGSPASSYSSTSSLFASGGATPKVPSPWIQAKDPEGRHFFLNPKTGDSQWDFPTA